MKLYLIRHGQSGDNLARQHSGWAQTPLTEQGENDARMAGERLAGIPFDKIFCSDTHRAVQTCALALPDRQEEVEYTALIRETNVGSLTGQRVSDCQEKFGEVYEKNRRERNFRDYGGEDLAMHMERVRTFLTRVEEGNWETVAAFCHGGSIHAVLDIVLGSIQDKSLYPCSNGSVSVFEFADGRWSLTDWNRV